MLMAELPIMNPPGNAFSRPFAAWIIRAACRPGDLPLLMLPGHMCDRRTVFIEPDLRASGRGNRSLTGAIGFGR